MAAVYEPVTAGASEPTTWHHGVAVAVLESGVLILGAAGSGKTSLALALMADVHRQGRFARLVGDDRIAITPTNGRLVARPHPRAAGLIERRGQGVRPIIHEAACVLNLVVELVSDDAHLPERCPDVLPSFTLAGVRLPKLILLSAWGARENGGRVFDRLSLRQTDQ